MHHHQWNREWSWRKIKRWSSRLVPHLIDLPNFEKKKKEEAARLRFEILVRPRPPRSLMMWKIPWQNSVVRQRETMSSVGTGIWFKMLFVVSFQFLKKHDRTSFYVVSFSSSVDKHYYDSLHHSRNDLMMMMMIMMMRI